MFFEKIYCDTASQIPSFLNCLICIPSSMAAQMVDRASLTGNHNHTPATPKNLGKMNKQGMSTNTCRESDSTMAYFALPIL